MHKYQTQSDDKYNIFTSPHIITPFLVAILFMISLYTKHQELSYRKNQTKLIKQTAPIIFQRMGLFLAPYPQVLIAKQDTCYT